MLRSITRLPIASRAFTSVAARSFSTGTPIFQQHSFKLEEEDFVTFNCEAPQNEVSFSKEELLEMYRQMNVMRRLEMAADALYKSKMIRGFCHLCIGQEAVSVGMEKAASKKDHIITSYRCHGFTWIRGGSIKSIIAELMGRKDGISLGKGGSMHMFADRFYGGNGIVGAQVPLGAGLAFTSKYNEEDSCSFSLYGDGAANQGQVFEAFNMAKLWDLPAVFVCENNLYGMGTSAKRSSASTDYFKRGDYIPGIKVNGMDVFAVYQACKYARDWTTSGKGPLVLEMHTYRYGGHSMSDPGTTYRTREEIQRMRSTRDPITGLKSKLIDTGVATEEELKEIEKVARKEVDEETAAAKGSPEPPVEDLWSDIYIKGTEPKFLRGRESQEIHQF
ncbi:alpha subunit of pyruvate dehydrogenase [Basidiobolus ranarum]|uniref:Pyruvate dehydrogenase E1 component subunit alpha n=1 Tax=Basidiobolus ranarum TaxID=34480 RepID=A0ABR2W3M8_9FUNG